jgi:hypothetical protein
MQRARRVLTSLRELARAAPRRGDALALASLALAVRLVVVAWGGSRFPPIDDGRFYQIVADRIAHGLGYTWAWPDGAVTYAAHYPVGYPGLLGAFYALFGSRPVVGMLVNALLGALSVYAVQRLLAVNGSRLAALLGALLLALHPALVLYTPALMTEGVAAAAITISAWLCLRASTRGVGALLVAGLALGACTLIRPQLVLAVPFLGLLATPAAGGAKRRIGRAALVSVLAVTTCLPWTLRNCSRLEACVFVSANGGWNLLIGSAPEGEGHFIPLDTIGVPSECREVFGEADKDRCFGRAAKRRIAEQPLVWLSLAPLKLMRTFEYAGAAGYYLHASNPAAFDYRAKLSLATIETVYQRVVLVLGVIGAARLLDRRYRRAGRFFLALGAACALLPVSFVTYLTLVLAALLLGKRAFDVPALVAGAAVIGTTALTHAIFFGEGRYGLVVFPLAAAAAGLFALPLRAGSRAEPASAAERDGREAGRAFDRNQPAGDTSAVGDPDAAHRN